VTTVAIITHAQDQLVRQDTGGFNAHYMVGPILSHLTEAGHTIVLQSATSDEPLAADLALMHVDLTVVPEAYAALARSYPVCLNVRPLDISKRKTSAAALKIGEPWTGPVIVKSNWNFNGYPEKRLNQLALAQGEPIPYPGLRTLTDYAIFNAPHEVPLNVRDDPDFVTERFIPERNGKEFAVRFWAFMGAEERCTICYSRQPIVKSASILRFEHCEVPADLRALRKEMGFDFGKFDFVVHDGKSCLIDANKTPGAPPTKGATWVSDFARGFLNFAK